MIIESTETPLFSERRRFAGSIDARMRMPDGKLILVDYKSSLEPQLVPQIGAYQILLEENAEGAKLGLGLELRENGTYRCKWFDAAALRRAEQLFMALLTTYRYGKQEGIFE